VVTQDLPCAVKLGQRIKASGATFLLDLHYSDTWADPQKQFKPAAWTNLTFAALEKQVEAYTAEVLKTFKEARCLPEIVQVGNEITPGFLWPDGKLGKKGDGWEEFAILLKAGIRGVKKPLSVNDRVKIMIHIDRGGDAAATRWFFDGLAKQQVPYDMIGLSFYPWWHGGMDKLRENLNQAALRFDKEIVVVETAYPWRPHGETKNMSWPMTPRGQEQFLRELVATVRATPNSRGKGVIWWYPESVRVPGLYTWKGGDVALFDAGGGALPALNVFGQAESGAARNSR
jgi:arabinogalactan endo-1,4-beta-galactosidase